VFLRDDLLVVDVAVQSDGYVVAFWADSARDSRVLGGILSNAELTGGGIDGLCGTSSSSTSAVNFCLESLPCSIQNAAIAWLST